MRTTSGDGRGECRYLHIRGRQRFHGGCLEVTVQDARSLKGLTPSDFDIINNVAGGFIDPVTGEAPAEYADDGISISRKGKVLRIEAKPFNMAGRSEGYFRHIPWELRCAADSTLSLGAADVNGQQHIAVIDDCIKGSFTFAGITREYMLHLATISRTYRSWYGRSAEASTTRT